MSLLPTLFTILGSILVAVITHWLPKLTERKQNFKERIQQAKDFHFLYLNRKNSKLVKDRAAQDLAFSTRVNYRDVEFLIHFDDFDFLIDRYSECKNQLKPIKSNSRIINYELTSKWPIDVGLAIGYVVGFTIASLPFLRFNQYSHIIEESIAKGIYLNAFNYILIPIIFGVAAIVCVAILMKRWDARSFLKELDKRKEKEIL